MRSALYAAVAAAFLLSGTEAQAQAANGVACPDSGLFSGGGLLTDICWECIFPIQVAGAPLMGGTGDIPGGAAEGAFCLCEDPNGVPEPGITISFWEPTKIVELVRRPGCAPTLGGVELPVSDWRGQGMSGLQGADDGSHPAFYHYHTYAFPLVVMMNLFVEDRCLADSYMDLDLMFMSELDPTWTADYLSFYSHPEAAAVANHLAQAACAVDAVAANAGAPIDEMFWCAGSWGSIYPFSGHTNQSGGMPSFTSLLASRVISAGHRRGLMWHTMGRDALCGGYIHPFMTKSMYKLQMQFPVSQTSEANQIGRSALQWGANRTIPGVGEDAVYVIFRWLDCCANGVF